MAFDYAVSVPGIYKAFRTYGAVRWAVDIAITALAGVILGRNPDHTLMIAAAYTVAATGISLVIFLPLIRPRSETDPRPPMWMTAALAGTRVLQVPAAALMFWGYTEDSHGNSRRDLSHTASPLQRRIYVGNISGSLNQRLAIVCRLCLRLPENSVAGIRQLFFIKDLHSRPFSPDEIAQEYRYRNGEKRTPKRETDHENASLVQ